VGPHCVPFHDDEEVTMKFVVVTWVVLSTFSMASERETAFWCPMLVRCDDD